MAAKPSIYRGFSAANFLKNKTFAISNIECVKQDLLNHIWTVKGQRVMMPDFGTRIPILTFEPNDPTTVAIIEADLTAVFNYDPRVDLISLNVMSLPNNSAIIALADLFYKELQITDVLHIEIPTS